MIRVRLYVHCEHPDCRKKIAGPPVPPSTLSDTTIVRGKAQQAGWTTRRGHAGIDLCPYHADEAVA